MLLSITQAVIIGIVTALIIGIGTWWIKSSYSKKQEHDSHHKQMEDLPEILEKHSAVHDEISIKLELARETDVVTMRTQLLQIHERLMTGEVQSIYWKRQFYDIYTVYQASYGNSWAEDLKRDVDDM